MSESKVDKAKQHLQAACQFYCNWYDSGSSCDSGGVAYELVTWIREALSELEEESTA